MTRRILTALLCLANLHTGAQNALPGSRLDSVQTVDDVVVVSRWQRSAIPVQALEGEVLQRLSAHSVADAMRYFAGVQIKDFGGIGGLKTVNVRSLGTNHTGVFYDGVEMGNAQNGVVDLGRFSLDNMESVTMYNGQKSNIFQTAKDYASASAVYLQARTPTFGRKAVATPWAAHNNLRAAVKGGAFATLNPSVLWEHEVNSRLSTQLSAEVMSTSGRYKFRYATKGGYDTTQVRRNGDLYGVRVETGLYGKMDDGTWRAKVYFYNSERGYPGAAVREEPGKFTHQDRQWDTNVFAQGGMRKRFSERYSLQVNAKAAYDYLHYLSDPREDVSTMYTNNHYRQKEAYASAAHLFTLSDSWTVSLANDLQWNHLSADLTNFVYPTRWTVLTALSTALHFRQGSVQGSVLHTYATDHIRHDGGMQGHKSELTPTLAASWQPWGAKGPVLRAFYKRIFRLPTFNDLYYTFIGSKELKPEYTDQWDAGATHTMTWREGVLRSMELKADLYYNSVDDKIVAMPTSNQFRWTMLNFGHCEIWGADVSAALGWQAGEVSIDTRATYTYNKAQDKTDPASPYYGGQLPYIPWHSASAIVSAAWRGWTANYSFIYTGERYEASANIAENYSKPWYTSDLSVSRLVHLGGCLLRVTAEVDNLFDQQYEVVQCYPMPGIHFMAKAAIEI